MNIRLLGLSLYGPKAASHRIRLAIYEPYLRENNIELDIQSLLDDKYLTRRFQYKQPSYYHLCKLFFNRIKFLLNSSKYDLAILHGELIPFMPYPLEKLFLNLPYIYDFDDALHIRYQLFPWKLILGNKFPKVISKAVSVNAGNLYLYNYSKRFNNNVMKLPSIVDTSIFKPTSLQKKLDKFTIGWLGSPTTVHHLDILIEPLKELSKLIPLRFVVIGSNFLNIDGVEIVRKEWSLDTEVQLIQNMDVGVMPLYDTPFAKGKCAFKLIQYMSCGIPVVASSVGTNLEVVPQSCGFLASNTREWFSALQKLAMNQDLRFEMGLAARLWVEKNYSLNTTAPMLMQQILKSLEIIEFKKLGNAKN